jgi:hypothetical protein
MHALLLLGLGLVLSGCTVYSVDLEPPIPPAAPAARRPLDLSISLGDVQLWALGMQVPLDADDFREIDADFRREVEAAGLVRTVLPHGSVTDLYYDTVRHVRPNGMTAGQRVYQVAILPLALVTPVPYPWSYHVDRRVRLRGQLRGETVLDREYDLHYTASISGPSYWSFLLADPLLEAEGDYLRAALTHAIDADWALFEQLEAEKRAGRR